jgi:chromosome segregation ATPase
MYGSRSGRRGQRAERKFEFPRPCAAVPPARRTTTHHMPSTALLSEDLFAIHARIQAEITALHAGNESLTTECADIALRNSALADDIAQLQALTQQGEEDLRTRSEGCKEAQASLRVVHLAAQVASARVQALKAKLAQAQANRQAAAMDLLRQCEQARYVFTNARSSGLAQFARRQEELLQEEAQLPGLDSIEARVLQSNLALKRLQNVQEASQARLREFEHKLKQQEASYLAEEQFQLNRVCASAERAEQSKKSQQHTLQAMVARREQLQAQLHVILSQGLEREPASLHDGGVVPLNQALALTTAELEDVDVLLGEFDVVRAFQGQH